MKTSLLRVVVALLALTFIAVACASDTGSTWTFAPVAAAEGEQTALAEPVEADEPAVPADAAAEVEPEAPAEPVAAEPEAPVAPAVLPGEPRVVEMLADATLRFTDQDGQPIADLPVTPGETILFRINNTAGFQHNFWIGTDSELMIPNATTDVGLTDWTTGIEELEWVVPDDITGLKFGCTVPGHYFTMQGTFSEGAPVVAEPGLDVEPPDLGDLEPPALDGEARVIEFEADATLRFMQDGEQMREIAVTPGEKVVFRIDNTAGFAHNFYIGADEQLSVANNVTDDGIPDWETGIQELEWVVPEDITDLRFACTVPGHYTIMQGDFVVSS